MGQKKFRKLENMTKGPPSPAFQLLGLLSLTNYDYRIWRESSPCLTFQGAKPSLKHTGLMELGARAAHLLPIRHCQVRSNYFNFDNQ